MNTMTAEQKISADEKSLTLSSEEIPYTLSLRIDGFTDPKQHNKFIKNVEQLVRKSWEYKHWISYITEVLDNTECCLTYEKMSECSIEIHHHPIDLFTLVKAVIDTKIVGEEEFCTFDIANEVIQLHFSNNIGYMPLLSDLHEKYHNGYLSLPIEFVQGNYTYILDNYCVEDEDKKDIQDLQKITKQECVISWSKDNYASLSIED